MNRPRFSTLLAVLTLALAGIASSASAAEPIGRTTDVARKATAQAAGANRDLILGATVAALDTIVTDTIGKAAFRFIDDTQLSVGPNSSVKLDKFVFNGDPASSAFVLRASKGVFRFATGRGDHDSYRIQTPAATIGVRGTRFDVNIQRDGQVRVSVLDGEVILCPHRGRANFVDCVTATVGQSILSGLSKASVVLTSTLPAIRADLLPLTSVANAAGGLLQTPAAVVGGAASAATGIVGGATGALGGVGAALPVPSPASAGAAVGGATGAVGGLAGGAAGGLGGAAGGVGSAVGGVGGAVGGLGGAVGGALGGLRLGR